MLELLALVLFLVAVVLAGIQKSWAVACIAAGLALLTLPDVGIKL
jgi:hypothetical protein